jgi:hypothetical protein
MFNMVETVYFFYNLLSIASIAHFVFPFLLGSVILKRKWVYGILILIIFEIYENVYAPIVDVLGINILAPEPFINILADLVIGSLGLYLGYLLSWRKR